jgi:hypothetical protein
VSLDAFIWTVKDAPKANVEEHGVLSVMADEVNESGLGCFLATSTIAARAILSDKTVQRRIDDMLRRGLIGFGDQTLAAKIRADRRPVVYNILIPYACFGSIKRVNEARVAKGLPPLTPEPCPTPAAVACGCPEEAGSPHAQKPEQCPKVVRAGCGCPPEHGAPHRPEQAEAPTKKRRADAGVKRAAKNAQVTAAESDGGTSSHPVDSDGVTPSPVVDGGTTSPAGLVNADGGTSSSPRGVRQSPDPKDLDPDLDPEKPPPTSLRTEVVTSTTVEAVTGGEEESSEDLKTEERDALTEALDAALSQRHADPRWFRDAVITAMRDALAQDFPPAAVAAGIRRMALDPESKYPGRLSSFLALDRRAAGAAGDGGAGVFEPKRVLGRDDPRCRKHPQQLATNCAACAGEAKAPDEPPGSHPAAVAGDPDRYLRQVRQRRVPASTLEMVAS